MDRRPFIAMCAAGAAAVLSGAATSLTTAEAARALRRCVTPVFASTVVRQGAVDPRAALRLVVNIPAFRLDVFADSERVRSYRVAIGMPGYPTPRGTFVISELQWNPWWIPPRSDWARNERGTPPGPANPMGKVKLAFRSVYYVHGTPDSGSLGKASSHGCVRLANADAIDLATLLQGALLGAQAHDSILAAALPSLRTIAVRLPAAVPIEIRYDLVELRTDTLFVYPDPYGLGKSPRSDALDVLLEAGLDSTSVDYARLGAIRRYPARKPIALPVHSYSRQPAHVPPRTH